MVFIVMTLNGAKGFTIIELMFAVLVVGALAAIAYPAYQNQLLGARRADATAALLEVAARQERFFAQNGSYSNNLGTGSNGLELDGAANPAFINSERGFYRISITAFSATPPSYSLTATAPTTSVQRNDNQCRNFAVNNLGERCVSPDGGNRECSNAIAEDCWQ